MLPGQSHGDPSSFYTSVYSQGQRTDSHTLYTLFSLFGYLLFTTLHPAAQPKLHGLCVRHPGSRGVAVKAGGLRGGGAGAARVSVGEQD